MMMKLRKLVQMGGRIITACHKYLNLIVAHCCSFLSLYNFNNRWEQLWCMQQDWKSPIFGMVKNSITSRSNRVQKGYKLFITW